MDEALRPVRSFGRVRGRPVKPGQAERLERLLPELTLEPGADPTAAVEADRPVWLEIGFGGGEHLAVQAAAHPDVWFLGAEPFVNGVAGLLRLVETQGLANVRVHPGDVRDLLAFIPAGRLDRVFVLFPDPWPKTRHHKRRLIQPEFVAELARLVRPGGAVRFATDWADYADQALRVFAADPRFVWTAQRAGDWRAPPADHVATRYEAKRLGDCAPIFLEFTRMG